jgi:hypothetical protein
MNIRRKAVVRRKGSWRWLRLVGRAVLWITEPMGGIFFCVPPARVIRQLPPDALLWTPEARLGKKDAREWAALEASLREMDEPSC